MVGNFSLYSKSNRALSKQTVRNLIRRRDLRRHVWFCAVCLHSIKYAKKVHSIEKKRAHDTTFDKPKMFSLLFVFVLICTCLCDFFVCMYVATLLLKLIGTRIRRRSHLLLMKTYVDVTLLPYG